MSAVATLPDLRLTLPPDQKPVLRSIRSSIAYTLLSFGLWQFAWLHDTLRDVGAATGRDLRATTRTWLFVLPVVNLVVLYRVWRDLDAFIREQGRPGFSPMVYVVLSLVPFGMVFTFIDVQMRLNCAWETRLGAGASRAPLGSFGGVTVGFGGALIAIHLFIASWFAVLVPWLLGTM